MSLFKRKKRPLARDAASLRDDRQFFVACDDTYAPKQYFSFFRLSRVHIEVVPTVSGTCAAEDVLKRLQEFSQKFDPAEDDELWMLLDTDHYTKGRHLKSFIATVKKAKQQNVNIALSKPCFELWLLLHHENEAAVGSLSNARDVAEALRAKLGQYDKTKLKRENYPLKTVPDAVKRAERLDESVLGGDIPQQNTSRVYLLWKAVVSKSLPSQLPLELRSLLDD
ncbi:MAG: RloB family protein [Terracidiphilus sp.]|nr:RloB family protein [Terracidiphilus sp.]